MHVYRDLAVKYGKIDPDDPGAVNRFFEKDVYNLSRFTRLRIIVTLFRHIGDQPEAVNFDILDKDEDVPLPDPANYKRADTRLR
jgi:hypothetical protein